MRVGIDIRALQIGHQYRGIGEFTKRVVNYVVGQAVNDKAISGIVFYEYEGEEDPKVLLDIPKDLNYTVVLMGPRTGAPQESKRQKIMRSVRDLIANPIPHRYTKHCDVYLQFDYTLGVPLFKKSVLMSYDFIPLIFYRDYFESAWVPFRNRAARTTLRTLFHNYRFKRIVHRSYGNSSRIVAISENTKKDILKFTPAKASKISVVHLGADSKVTKTTKVQNVKMPTKPYLLFIGAGDQRRRVDDLVAAFNNLKAEGHDIQLALAGENFVRQEHIPLKPTRDAVLESSYRDDIIMMGYVSDETRSKLYQNAIAYVYPTLYEGFGIPVLEAMIHTCPVITYDNSSVREAGGKHAFYASDWWDIKVQAEIVMKMNPTDREQLLLKAQKHAQKFTWENTAKKIYGVITQ